jgi:hypothetical protein
MVREVKPSFSGGGDPPPESGNEGATFNRKAAAYNFDQMPELTSSWPCPSRAYGWTSSSLTSRASSSPTARQTHAGTRPPSTDPIRLIQAYGLH